MSPCLGTPGRVRYQGYVLFVFTTLLWIPLPFGVSAEDAEPPPEVVVEGSQSLLGLLQQGGWAMWPLGALSLALLFLSFHGFAQTRRQRFIPATHLKDLAQRLAQRDFTGIQSRLAGSQTILAQALQTALEKVSPESDEQNLEQAESLFLDSIETAESNTGQWINYLNVIATVAPMVGLLGTVSGMISAFQTIARGGMGRPELLAGDIGEALVTTATGLVIGIPAMILYFILRNRLNAVLMETTHQGTDLLDHLKSN